MRCLYGRTVLTGKLQEGTTRNDYEAATVRRAGSCAGTIRHGLAGVLHGRLVVDMNNPYMQRRRSRARCAS